MAAKGTIAKENVIKKLEKTFGEDFIGEVNKKVYVWENDGGEKVQIAISLTCPKVYVETGSKPKEDFDWGEDDVIPEAAPKKVEITEEEKQKVADLMSRLGL